MINSGFIGFNAVLASIATYELVAADLRLVVLAAVLLVNGRSAVRIRSPASQVRVGKHLSFAPGRRWPAPLRSGWSGK
jgi:hypothetical protein